MPWIAPRLSVHGMRVDGHSITPGTDALIDMRAGRRGSKVCIMQPAVQAQLVEIFASDTTCDARSLGWGSCANPVSTMSMWSLHWLENASLSSVTCQSVL